MKTLKYYISAFAGIIFLVFLDQFTKYLAVSRLKDKAAFKLIPNVLHFEYVTNTGAAWGMFSGRQIMFIVLTLLVLLIIGYVYIKTPKTKKYMPLRITLVLLTSGALGNFIDRVVNNYVHDFIYFVPINFPVFNVADCYVTVSAVLLVVLLLFVYRKDDDFDYLKPKKKGKND